ncbi:MAG: nuclear transport factor 2 family protein [Actinomycetota bacterium]
MTPAPESFARYLAAWNEPDPAKVRAHLDLAVTEDVVFADPANCTVGVSDLEALICKTRAELPTAEYGLASEVDGGHDGRYRYHWDVRIDGEVAVVGTDFTTVDADGRIERIDGFFNDLPRGPKMP